MVQNEIFDQGKVDTNQFAPTILAPAGVAPLKKKAPLEPSEKTGGAMVVRGQPAHPQKVFLRKTRV